MALVDEWRHIRRKLKDQFAATRRPSFVPHFCLRVSLIGWAGLWAVRGCPLVSQRVQFVSNHMRRSNDKTDDLLTW